MTVQPTVVHEASPAAPVPEPRELELSVLIPVLDEESTVADLAARVAAVLDRLGKSFEIVFVDDGSRDATAARVREAHRLDPRVKLVRLRRNFGKAAALCAGYDHSQIGKHTSELQSPCNLVCRHLLEKKKRI